MSDSPPLLPYGRQSVDAEDLAAVVECLRGDWLTQGPRVEGFEAALRAATGAPHAVAVSNGTTALHLAYAALGIGAGDVVVVPAITFVATANAARYLGADVRFADVEPDTGLVDSADVERVAEELAREGRAPALFAPVHMAGQPADLVSIAEIAARHDAWVVEDAAHALGAKYRTGAREHTIGDCAHSDAVTLSFHPVKHVTTGEGGAILCADDALRSKLALLRSHGLHKDASRFEIPPDDPRVGPWYYEMAELGFNYRLSDIQCALGMSQMSKLPAFLRTRRELAARYDAALAGDSLSSAVAALRSHGGRVHAYHLYVIRVVPSAGESTRDVAARRKDLYAFLRERRIAPQVHYVPVPWQPYYREHASDRRYPGAEAYYAGCLSLPLFPAMTSSDVDRVVDALRAWVSRS